MQITEFRDNGGGNAELSWTQASMDRDLGWVEFNRRVLHEALDERTPLLERLKFLGIFSSNLDEFFMKRIGVLREKAEEAAERGKDITAQAARQHLASIREAVLPLLAAQADCFANVLVPKLAAHGIWLLTWEQLSDEQRAEAVVFFESNVSAALTPLALDPGHPFPFLSNLSTSLGFVLRSPESEENQFARVKVPSILSHWVALKTAQADGRCYVRLHDLIRHNAERLFPGMTIVDATLFRVSRNAEVEPDDDDLENLSDAVSQGLRQRRFAPVVRLEIQNNPNPWVRQLLLDKFELAEQDIYEVPGELDYTGLFAIAGLDLRPLRDEPWSPVAPAALADEEVDIFSVIRTGALLVHHPYESFDASVERFIRLAAADPKTVAIKMTVYRVGDDTPFVRALVRAAEAGKQVACLIELQARFDEERNLHWARELEKAGAHVVYGVLGLKTHTKIALVVRQEGSGLRCYAHIGTGNYHVKTARLYTDLGLFTCDQAITSDVVNLFHYLTGRSREPVFTKLLVAPLTMRERFLQMIAGEIAHCQAGRPAYIIAKMNQLEEGQMCQAICRASQAGVPVDLFVRGFSCLRPGIAGLSERVRIRSIIGRFLEHSRIFYFANGAADPLDGEFVIGSADWMQRNLSRRVEAIVPIETRAQRERLWEILEILRQDCRQAWDMQPDGSYVQQRPPEDATGPALSGTHATLMELTRARAKSLRPNPTLRGS